MNNNIVFNDAFFKFHPVGQGLFYSGRIHDFMLNEYEYENYFEKYLDTHIRDNYFHRNYRMFKHHFYSKAMGKNNVFDFIYDIGSDNKEIIQQVRDYVRFLDRSNKTKIDLLVLSHLDRDHVNGLKELNTINKERLSEGKQIIRLGTVVLPLLHEDEKFYLVSKQLIGDSTKDEPEKWYYELLNDTSSFFSNFGDPTLVFFNGNGPINDDIHPNDNLTNNVSEQINHYYKSDSITKDTFLTNKTPIKVYQWEFIFYDIRDKIPSDDLINFKKEVNKLVQENIDSDSLDNLLTESPEILEGLKKLYKGLKYTYNEKSICMLHRPVKQVIAFSCYEMGHTNINKFLERSQYGTLLTGDFNLNSDRNFLEDFEQYYLADINSAYILQLPHHGAVSSNSKRALEYMRNVRYCIASHGISNRHRHPDYEVIYYTTKEDKEFVHVHDKNDVLNIEF